MAAQNGSRKHSPVFNPKSQNGNSARQSETKAGAAKAPYNFIPFPEDPPLIRYEKAEDLPSHSQIDPALCTGQIRVSLTAETPVCVSEKKGGTAEPAQDASGRYILPGSSLRGLLRENMQILSFAPLRPGEDFQDRRFFYREMASNDGELRRYYQKMLGIRTHRTPEGKPVTEAERVKAGYLCREGEHYEIRPVKGSWLRVPRQQVKQIYDGDARVFEVSYTRIGNGVEKVHKIDKQHPAKPDMLHGWLLFTGKPVSKKIFNKKTGRQQEILNTAYIFPDPDRDVKAIPLTQEDITLYQEDFEDRKNALGKNASFWQLPEDGKSKPVFYVTGVSTHTFFGMSQFLRIGYPHSVGDGLPEAFKALNAASEVTLDYPHSMLGYAAETGESYRSRVSVEDFPAVGEPGPMAPISMILGEPRASYYPGYVKKGGHYGKADFQMRGYKQYWLKAPQRPLEGGEFKNSKVVTKLRPLPQGTRFSGVIHYQNLHPDELGLLLWALRLEKGCFQQLGMGKPYGYGRMRLTIDALEECDLSRLYTPGGLCGGPDRSGADAVQKYIDCYREYAQKLLERTGADREKLELLQKDSIQDFLYQRSHVMKNAANVSYMDLRGYKNKRTSLPTVSDLRPAQKNTEEDV